MKALIATAIAVALSGHVATTPFLVSPDGAVLPGISAVGRF